MDICIRPAENGDVPAMLAVYVPYVQNTAVSFEYSVPTEYEFRSRYALVTAVYPWLIAEYDGRVAGYAYASRFHPRAAYDWCAEVSIYIDRSYRGRGMGRLLYEHLERILTAQNVLTTYACIAHTQEPDEYLDHSSIHFHTRMGYHLTGSFPRCGFKFNRWYGMIWMEKRLNSGIIDADNPAPAPLLPFSAVRERFFPHKRC
ncbi:MAG: N-acetyltransferase [Mailhella sp.]|nr:N-acetyltransferase [Mailhella sp.]